MGSVTVNDIAQYKANKENTANRTAHSPVRSVTVNDEETETLPAGDVASNRKLPILCTVSNRDAKERDSPVNPEARNPGFIGLIPENIGNKEIALSE